MDELTNRQSWILMTVGPVFAYWRMGYAMTVFDRQAVLQSMEKLSDDVIEMAVEAALSKTRADIGKSPGVCDLRDLALSCKRRMKESQEPAPPERQLPENNDLSHIKSPADVREYLRTYLDAAARRSAEIKGEKVPDGQN